MHGNLKGVYAPENDDNLDRRRLMVYRQTDMVSCKQKVQRAEYRTLRNPKLIIDSVGVVK